MPTFFNQATLTYDGKTVNSNIATGEILEVLTVTKTAVVDEYTNGSQITYAINVTNTSAQPVSGIVLSDNLGAYTFGTETLVPLDYVDGSVKYFINGSLQPTPTIATNPFTISNLSIPAGGVATVLYTVETNNLASPEVGGSITNTVSITGGGGTAEAEETITAVTEPSLSLNKTVSPATVPENGSVTYTLTIENTGNTEAGTTDNPIISDTFDPRLTGLSVVYEGAVWTENVQYTYNETTGLFTTLPGAITVPAATFSQDPATGVWTTTPGTSSLTITGNIVA